MTKINLCICDNRTDSEGTIILKVEANTFFEKVGDLQNKKISFTFTSYDDIKNFLYELDTQIKENNEDDRPFFTSTNLPDLTEFFSRCYNGDFFKYENNMFVF